MEKLLNDNDFEVTTHGATFCPFHDNTDSPSAKFYVDNEGVGSIFCFAEHRRYMASDVVIKILELDVSEVFDGIWDKLSDARKEDIISSSKSPFTPLPDSFIEFQQKVVPEFKSGRVGVNVLLEGIIRGLGIIKA